MLNLNLSIPLPLIYKISYTSCHSSHQNSLEAHEVIYQNQWLSDERL